MQTFRITGTYTDLYQLSMGQVYYLSGKGQTEAVFDYFFRKVPFSGGYVVFAGLSDLLKTLEEFSFSNEELDYLKDLGLKNVFVESLRNLKFHGTIHSVNEGEVVFPNEPIVRVTGPMIQVQIIETLLLNILNFQSLIATKAARMRSAAGDRILSDFGLRRAQGIGGYHATRASIIGGFDSTSNVKAAMDFELPAVGTMAHSFIQSYGDELSAFRDFAEKRPEHCVLLVDTYDTLKSGVPNAITVAKEMMQSGNRLQGIRLDSGDLAYLSKQARKMLDDAGLNYVKITASNQLDEYVIKSLLDQKAPIDVFGVGTSLVTGPPDAALDGVYKLAFADGKPRIKISENIKKLTLPDKKQVHRLLNEDGKFVGADIITLEDEQYNEQMFHLSEPEKALHLKDWKREPLLKKVMENGKILESATVHESAAYCKGRLALLPEEHQRFEYPHIYKVGISKKLQDLRNELKNQYKGK
jgi:nicotinate phosphoribosyltransferase